MRNYISKAVRRRVRNAFDNRCSYCRAAQRYILSKLEIEHIIPFALGGGNDEWNLCLACRLCNLYKSYQIEAIDPITKAAVALFNPRTQAWSDHFQWGQDGAMIVGLTPVGRATVEALQLNNEIAVEVRRNWVLVGWHPPSDAK
ncbi:MAG: HNH endonuclease [Blastocatellia bacterium]